MWKQIIHTFERKVDDARDAFDRLSGISDPIEIKCYPGYGNETTLFIRGRVLKKKELPESLADDGKWRNFLNTTRNWFTDEIAHAELEVRLEETSVKVTADDEGYFTAELPRPEVTPGLKDAVKVAISLLSPSTDAPVVATSEVHIPGPGCEFGIISDIDDTVIHTGATSLISMIKNTFLSNVHTRVVFDGVSALYAALARGIDGRGRNPFFYVTSSPWNLFDLITRIFEMRTIPAGPLFMTDWGIDENKFVKSGHHSHKENAIKKVLAAYPELKFVLIGDSGQEDPEIYTHVLSEFPDRILALYIRDVTTDERDSAVVALSEKAKAVGVDLVLAEDSVRIANHAIESGFIEASELPAIAGQAKSDAMADE